MAKSYLDNAGLSYLWGKLKAKFSEIHTEASDAYDYADACMDEINSLKQMFKIKTYTYAYSSISNGGSLNVTATNLQMSTPSGYTPIAAQQVSSGNGNVVARTWNVAATGSTAAVALRNVSTSSQSGTVTFVVVYAKTSAITS